MNISHIDLLRSLLEGRLAREMDSLLEALQRGFNVVVRSDDGQLMDLVCHMLETLEVQGPGRFAIIHSFSDFVRDDAPRSLPVILLDEDASVPAGAGFVPFQLPEMDALLPSWGSLVMKILSHFRQEAFVDSFDGKMMAVLKEILHKRGLATLIDSVMFAAYTAGAAGDYDRALRGLQETRDADMPRTRQVALVEKGSGGNLSSHAEAFFRGILTRTEPAHQCTKAALSLYVVKGMGYSISEASRVLKVSRTTIQDHLKLARDLGLDGFFPLKPRGQREYSLSR